MGASGLHSSVVAELPAETRALPEHAENRRWVAVVSVAVAVAAVGGTILRFWAPSPLWLDEALSVNIAHLPFSDMVEALRHDGHPLLYYVLLGWWIDLFGNSDFAVRSLSGVMSASAVPVLWALGRRIDRRTGQVALILALSSPYLLRYGTETRMYALLVLLVALGWLAVLRAMESPTIGRLVAVAFVAAALVYTQYWSFWLISAVVLMLLWCMIRDAQLSSAARRVLAAILAGSATLIPWINVLYDQVTTTGTPWAGRARPAEVAMEVVQAIGGSRRFEGETLGIMFLIAALIGTFALAAAPDRIELGRPANGTALGAAVATTLTLAIGAGMALVTAEAFEPRYAAVVIPFMLVLAARGIVMFPENIAMVLLAVVLVGSLAVGADDARRDRTQAGDVAAAIESGARPGDLVAFCPDQVGPSTLRELKSNLATVAYPSGTGRFVDWAHYLQRVHSVDPVAFANRLDQQAAGGAIWLVWGQGYRGFEGKCEAIIDTLAAHRDATIVVSPSAVFEAMALERFGARR